MTAARSLGSRVLISCLAFAAFAALSFLLPVNLPGELPASALTPHAAAACDKCPVPERLAGVGVQALNGHWYVTVRFATDPINARLTVSLTGTGADVTLRQVGTGWHNASPSRKLPLTSLAQRGDVVVLAFPASLPITGVAAATGAGDRIPIADAVPPVYAAPVHFNAADAVLLLVLVATAVYGYRRGVLAECADLLAIAIALVVARLASGPLAVALADVTAAPRLAQALASAGIVVIVGLAGYLVVPRALAWTRPSASALTAPVRGGLGAVAACVRQLAVLAVIVSVAIQASVAQWAAPSITTSVIGSALLRASRAMLGR